MTNDRSEEDALRAAVPTVPDEQQAVALEEAASWVGDGVVAVGLGATAEGEPCVVVHTQVPGVDLPSVVNGLPVRVELSGPVQAYETARTDPETHHGQTRT
jgi:hypothetical protein